MEVFQAAAAAHYLGGNNGYFLGRIYRNEHEYRRRYRERADVGGFFGSILSSSEFDSFLNLLCVLLAGMAVAQATTAPVTAIATLVMLYLHFERTLLGQGRTLVLDSQNYHHYTFHPQRIKQDGQWYRLLTGPLLHERKLHLYLNMLTLNLLGNLETSFTFTGLGYALFLFGLTAASSMGYMMCLERFGEGLGNNSNGGGGGSGRRAYQIPGFSGVIFALKAYVSVVGALTTFTLSGSKTSPYGTSFSHAVMERYAFARGSLLGPALPFSVPLEYHHLVELFVISVLFGDEGPPFWANVGGIMAGYAFAALEVALVAANICSPWIQAAVSKSSHHHGATFGPTYPDELFEDEPEVRQGPIDDDEWPRMHEEAPRHDPFIQGPTVAGVLQKAVKFGRENALSATLVIIGLTYMYTTMQQRERDLHRRLKELERERYEMDQHRLGDGGVPREVPIKPANAKTASVASDDPVSSAFSIVSENKDELDDGSETPSSKRSVTNGESLYEDASVVDGSLPIEFNMALEILCTETETVSRQDIITTLQTLHTVIHNATTKGQEKGEEKVKYRRIRVANPRIQKCNIPGAFDILASVGFESREDFDGEAWLVFPNKPDDIPEWISVALLTLQAHADRFSSSQKGKGNNHSQDDDSEDVLLDKAEMKRRVRAAALHRQKKARPKKRQHRESQFSPGLGGGNSKAIYFHGGT